jgi:acetyl esterase
MNIQSRALLFGLALITAANLQAQPPDYLTVRKAINDACMSTTGTRDSVEDVQSLHVVTGAEKIGARLYRPEWDGKLPVVVFIHGGGFVAGNLDTHDNACRYLCNRIPCLVVAVEYRLAPEHKYPTPLDDCYAATAWAAKNAASLGGDPDRLAVVGDSGGGTLAAAVCLKARDWKGPAIRCQVLVNPALDLSRWDEPDYPESYRWFREFYLKDGMKSTDPFVSPLLAESFKGLPPTFVVVGENDPLRAEGEAYVTKLRGEGVRANVYCHYGQGHLGPLWGAAALPAEEPLIMAISFLRVVFRSITLNPH